MSDYIHKRMAAILAEFPAVPKERSGAGISYKYRGIDDALRALNPLLAKHGVYMRVNYLAPEFTAAAATSSGKPQFRCVLTGEMQFTADDGSFASIALAGEGIDTADKALMKAQANALKYGIWYTFCVPTDEKKDSEAFDGEDDDDLDFEPRKK